MSQKVKDLSGKTFLQELEDMRYNKDSITSCRINVLHLNSPSGIYLAPLTPQNRNIKDKAKFTVAWLISTHGFPWVTQRATFPSLCCD